MSALPATTAAIVRHWADRRPDHVALRAGDVEVTFADLHAASSRVAQALKAAGVGPQERVCYIDKNGVEQVELLFGAAKLNAVPTPVNFRLAPPEIAAIVRDSEARVFAVGADFLPAVERIEGDLDGVTIIAIGPSDRHPTFGDWRDAHGAEDPEAPQEPGDIAFQLYSSGTTGRPKGVLLSQANLAYSASLYPDLLGLGRDSVSMIAMPLFHIGGGGWMLTSLAAGATGVLVRDLVPADVVDVIERHRITQTFIVPAVLQFILGVPGVEDRDLSAFEVVMYGASPISEKVLAEAIRVFGCDFVQVYGLTESTGSVTALPAADHDLAGPNRHRLRSIGFALPGAEVRVADPATGDTLPPREVGEIWIKGRAVMQGYWKMPDATRDAITADGWLRSGDAGYSDEDGYLYVYDRVKDMIVSGGENIYPAEVENVLMDHPAVADAAVIGIPDERWGESPKAVLVRRPGEEVTDAELLAFCRERLAGFKCPKSIDWVDALPRNPTGKILKKELRAPYWAGRDRLVG